MPPEATLTVKLIGCPCVSVMGLVAGVVKSERLVVVVVKLEVQLLTRFATLTEPNPVAKSYPVVAGYAALLPETMMPYCPEVLLLQLGAPTRQITELFPTVMS